MIRFLYIILIFSFILHVLGYNITKPEPEKKRESIFGGPLKFSTETGSFSAGSVGD